MRLNVSLNLISLYIRSSHKTLTSLERVYIIIEMSSNLCDVSNDKCENAHMLTILTYVMTIMNK